MPSEHQAGIAAFLRKYVRLLADFSVLYSILDDCEKRRKPPFDWKSTWHEIEQSEDYKKTLNFFEPLICEFEQARSETDLIALLHKISATPKPN